MKSECWYVGERRRRQRDDEIAGTRRTCAYEPMKY